MNWLRDCRLTAGNSQPCIWSDSSNQQTVAKPVIMSWSRSCSNSCTSEHLSQFEVDTRQWLGNYFNCAL